MISEYLSLKLAQIRSRYKKYDIVLSIKDEICFVYNIQVSIGELEEMKEVLGDSWQYYTYINSASKNFHCHFHNNNILIDERIYNMKILIEE